MRRSWIKLLTLVAAGSVLVNSTIVLADSESQIVLLREGKTAQLVDGVFSLKLLKISGYWVDVRVEGERRKLKFGDAVASPDDSCSITFSEISPETRLARFHTDCL